VIFTIGLSFSLWYVRPIYLFVRDIYDWPVIFFVICTTDLSFGAWYFCPACHFLCDISADLSLCAWYLQSTYHFSYFNDNLPILFVIWTSNLPFFIIQYTTNHFVCGYLRPIYQFNCIIYDQSTIFVSDIDDRSKIVLLWLRPIYYYAIDIETYIPICWGYLRPTL